MLFVNSDLLVDVHSDLTMVDALLEDCNVVVLGWLLHDVVES